MTGLEKWLIKKILQRALNPGRGHASMVMHSIFSFMYDQLSSAFTEDNHWTTASHMSEMLNSVIDQKQPRHKE